MSNHKGWNIWLLFTTSLFFRIRKELSTPIRFDWVEPAHIALGAGFFAAVGPNAIEPSHFHDIEPTLFREALAEMEIILKRYGYKRGAIVDGCCLFRGDLL
jgi:hypothetical protein